MKKIILILFLSIVLTGCSIGTYEGKTAEEWAETANNYESALQEANDNIDNANQMIEDAQGYAGANYEEMEEALSNLQRIENVNESF